MLRVGHCSTGAQLFIPSFFKMHSHQHIVLSGNGSFQITIGQTVTVKKGDTDEIALRCATEILGGGMTGRLMHTSHDYVTHILFFCLTITE